MSNREIKTLLIGFSLILFASLYYNISKRTEESTTADNIQAIVSIITLIVSIITIYFVYKAYQSQKDQLEVQKKEIDDNRKDVEYNRTLDILYKQLEYTEKKLKPIADKHYKKIVVMNTKVEAYENLIHYNWILNVLIENFSFYQRITKNEKFTIDEKYLLFDIINSNVNSEVLSIHFWFCSTLEVIYEMDNQQENKLEYLEFIEQKYFNDSFSEISFLKDFYENDDVRRMEKVRERFKDEIEDDLRMFDGVYYKIKELNGLRVKLRKKEKK